MFKLVLTLTNTHQVSHKLTDEEEALDAYFAIQQAMSTAANGQSQDVLALGDSLLIRADAIISCELKGPRTQ